MVSAEKRFKNTCKTVLLKEQAEEFMRKRLLLKLKWGKNYKVDSSLDEVTRTENSSSFFQNENRKMYSRRKLSFKNQEQNLAYNFQFKKKTSWLARKANNDKKVIWQLEEVLVKTLGNPGVWRSVVFFT